MDQRSGFDMKQTFSKQNISFIEWPEKPAILRINAMRQYLRGVYGPKVYIAENCTDLWYDVKHLTYRKLRSRLNSDQRVVITDKGKCLPDCLSMICHKESMSLGIKEVKEDPTWQPPRPSRIYKYIPKTNRDWDALELERIRAQMKG